ncbi:hypothetical protein [Burkholderia plantarii]|uniref:hypothetical protein n=1 Tax=Burkholderia plantarii TaxID=41899 RepID=UPI000870B41B|nr:hypothetical protein [Burkholderia plantarii]
MPQPTSSIQTGALTLSAASLVPIIDWAASRLGITIPADAQLQIAALLITGAHAIYNLLLERRASAAPAGTFVVPELGTTVTVVGAGAASGGGGGGGAMPAPAAPTVSVAPAPTAPVTAT